MAHVLFYKYLPAIAMEETREITVRSDNGPFPRGVYSLLEMYCDDVDCDCRKVLFAVSYSENKKMVAYIGYGWEDKEFYARLVKHDQDGRKKVCYDSLGKIDKKMVDELMGPCLNSLSPQSSIAEDILKFVVEYVLTDEAYVERLKKHYMLFKKAVKRSKKRKSAL